MIVSRGIGARDHVTPDYQAVYLRLTNLLKYSLQGWEIPVNVVDCGDLHDSLRIEGHDKFTRPNGLHISEQDARDSRLSFER